MEKIKRIRELTKNYMESIWFPIALAIVSLIIFFTNGVGFGFFFFVIILLILLLSGASFKAIIPLIIFYLSCLDMNYWEIPSAPYFFVLSIFLIDCIVLLVQIIKHFKEYILCFKMDFLLFSMLGILVSMAISIINTPDIASSGIGIGHFAIIILAYMLPKSTVDSTDKHKDYIILTIIFNALVFSIECIYMIIYRLNQGLNIEQIMHGKYMSFAWANSNHYTAFINIAIILSFYLFMKYKDIPKRIFIVTSIFIFIGINVFTVCRAGYLALLVTIILCLIYYFIYNKKINHYKIIKDLFYFIPFIVLGAIAIVLLWQKGVVEDFISHMSEFGISSNGRGKIFEVAITMFKAHPIIGAGVYSSHYYLMEIMEIDFWNYHNYALQMLGTCGIIGLLAFLGYLVFSIKRTWNKDVFSIFVGIIIIYFLIHGLFDTLYFNPLLMPILSVLQAMQKDHLRKLKRN